MESKAKQQWHEKTADAVHDENNIKGFFGEYRFLSNFYPCPVEFEGMLFPSAEAAYMSAKTTDPALKRQFQTLSAGEAKKLGRKLQLRSDWELIKFDVMETVDRDKFTRNADLRQKLLFTGNKFLEETNWWGDIVWGVCKGIGENNLGKTLMKIRSEKQKEEEAIHEKAKLFDLIINIAEKGDSFSHNGHFNMIYELINKAGYFK